MANEIEKVNTIAIADIEKFNGKTDDNIEKLNAFEFTGTVNPLFAGTRAVIAGGTGGSHADQNTIAYKTLGASADTVDFGDLTSYRSLMNGAGSNISRAIFAGGLSTGDGSSSVIYGVTDTDYITVGSTGDATDFGNLQTARSYGTGGGASNGTLLFSTGGGNQLPGESFVILDSMEFFTLFLYDLVSENLKGSDDDKFSSISFLVNFGVLALQDSHFRFFKLISFFI